LTINSHELKFAGVIEILVVATQFFTNVLINFQKNPKIEKNNENPKKYVFLICFHCF
jgi:hypothetical protein